MQDPPILCIYTYQLLFPGPAKLSVAFHFSMHMVHTWGEEPGNGMVIYCATENVDRSSKERARPSFVQQLA